jgi:AraC family transcriptional regulator of adaptative response / DNA-3-methyladenine glycosylase II
VREVFATTPTALRRARRTTDRPAEAGAIHLRLARREPFPAAPLLRFIGGRAIPGVEELVDGAYGRTLALPGGPGTVRISDAGTHVRAALRLTDVRDLQQAVARTRRLLDLDADPTAVDEVLEQDPDLGPLVRKTPGLRVPGAVDGHELAVRAVVGQQVSVAGARTVAGRIVAALGTPLAEPDGGLTHLFPTAEAMASVDPAQLPMPAARARCLAGVGAAVAAGELELDPGADRARTRAHLLSLPGIGPWTADYLAMRALGDPDVFLATDLGIRHALGALGRCADDAPAWAPWRSYATLHLWSTLG